MVSIDEHASYANSSAFVFTADIVRPAGANDRAVTVLVRDVMKAPAGLSGLVGREMTVHLREPLPEGSYVFFADLVSVSDTITVSETTHIDAERRDHAEASVLRGYAARLEPRLEAAWLVALGTIGDVTPLFPPSERRGRVPWALARFDIERVLKGSRARRRLTLIGPSPASKRLPRAPALRPGIHAVLLLQRPPDEAMEHIASGDRRTAGFIAETSDIQPPDRVDDLANILGDAEQG